MFDHSGFGAWNMFHQPSGVQIEPNAGLKMFSLWNAASPGRPRGREEEHQRGGGGGRGFGGGERWRQDPR